MTFEASGACPYPGALPFGEGETDRFFGRAEHIEPLRGLLRTERIVVLHSPSGAGKTSLIQAGLVPRMRKDGFKAVCPIHVGHSLPAQAFAATESVNRYSFSVIYSIEKALARTSGASAAADVDPRTLSIPLCTYFEHRTAMRPDGEKLLLVFDQFEKLFSSALHDQPSRLQFFSELGAVLQDRSIWAIFAIREQYVGMLDPFARLVPTHFMARYYLDFLTRTEAEEAIRKPLEQRQIPVEEAAIQRVLNDLSLFTQPTPVDDDPMQAGLQEKPDESLMDPLHLQLVCESAWQKSPKSFSVEAVEGVSKGTTISVVEAALMDYYERTLQEASRATATPERQIRVWIDREFMQARLKHRPSPTLPDTLSRPAEWHDFLEDRHILRAVLRAGSRYYELTHHRLSVPVRISNEKWFKANLSQFEWMARRWCMLEKPQGFDVPPWREWPEHPQLKEWLGIIFKPLKDMFKGYYRNLYGALAEEGTVPGDCDAKQYSEFCRDRFLKKWSFWGGMSLMAILLVVGAVLIKVYWDKESEEKSNRIQRLNSHAMQQRYTQQNHDVALLLGRLKARLKESMNGERADSGSDRLHSGLDSTVWAALEAHPFSYTLPEECLGGKPQGLLNLGSRVLATVKDDSEWRNVSIDLEKKKVELNLGKIKAPPFCADGPITISPDGKQLAVREEIGIRIRGTSKCEEIDLIDPPPGAEFSDKAPLYSPDGRHLAVLLAKGSAALYELPLTAGKAVQLPNVITPVDVRKKADGTYAYPVTTIFFKGTRLAVGDKGGGTQVFELKVGRFEPLHSFKGCGDGWPWKDHGEKTCGKENEYAEVVALSLSGSSSEVLTTVHAGGLYMFGGGILRRKLGGDDNSVRPVLPDWESRMRQKLAREYREFSDTPGEKFTSAYFDPGGHWLVTGGAFGRVMVWDLRDDPPIPIVKVPLDPFAEEADSEGRSKTGHTITGFAVPRKILTGIVGETRAVLTMEVPQPQASGREAEAKRRVVLAIDSAAGIRLWDLDRSPRSYLALDWAGTDYVYAVAFQSKDRLITTSNKGKLADWRWDRRPLRASRRNHHLLEEKGERIRSMDLNASRLALGLTDGTARLVDLDKLASHIYPKIGAEKTSARQNDILAIALRPNPTGASGQRFNLVTGDAGGKVVFWDLDQGGGGNDSRSSMAASCDFKGKVRSMAFHPGGRWLLLGIDGSSETAEKQTFGQLHLLDLDGKDCPPDSGKTCSGGPCIAWTLEDERNDKGELPPLPALPAVHGVTFSLDGKRFAACGDYGMIRWWDFEGAAAHSHRFGQGTTLEGARSRIHAVKFLPEDQNALVAVGQDGVLRLWTLGPAGKANPTPTLLRQALTEMQSLAVNPEGDLIAAGDSRGRLHLWDLGTHRYACDLVLRNLTWQEWSSFFKGDEDYSKVYIQVCKEHAPPRDLPEEVLVEQISQK